MTKPTTSAEIREAYLRFFEEKGCQRWPSSSLVPDDPSLLLTVAGMVQFKQYFLQQKHLDPAYVGTTTAQKCVRTNDIDIIGTDGRHLSFFEMLGNFSFGAYFKEEMCAWAWEFSVDVLGLDPERIHVTVYEDDDEAAAVWENVGVPKERITRLGDEDNFWVAGPTGPCGPCSEMYYDQGPEVGCGNPDCKPGCDCDRFLEYWNLVFTQYDRQEDGSLEPLAKKNIDTGMGLERVAGIQQGVISNFDTDVLRGLVAVGERLSGAAYGSDDKADLSLRIMADHSRAIVFMIGDGILPSNEGRGYVLRRLLRRAVRHGRLLGIQGSFLKHFLDEIVDTMGESYPEIVENKSLIEKVLIAEEERFSRTIDHGEQYLKKALSALQEGDVLDGKSAFTLYDTYGFPLELTAEIASERGVTIDEEGFDIEMAAQRDRARSARDDEAWEGFGSAYTRILDEHGPSEFVGYAKDECDASVIAIIATDGQPLIAAQEGDEVSIVLDKTPFYGEMGGQVGDTGTLVADGIEVEITGATHPEEGIIAHAGRIVSGTLRVEETVHAAIDARRRALIARNHTATHILQRALSKVLGDHVKQAGSLVAPDRLRFDFTHFESMTREQIVEVEALANHVIFDDELVVAYETSLTAAREEGVLALFGEKYGEYVRVIEVGSFSKELCGGTHVGHTSEIGFLKIVGESSIGANTRRVEAVTSVEALAYMNKLEGELRETAEFLGVPPMDVSERVARMAKRLDEFEVGAKRAKKIAAESNIAEAIKGASLLDGYALVIVDIGEARAEGLRNAWDVVKARAQAKPFALVAFAVNPEKETPLVLAAGNDAAVEAGFNANDVIRKVAPVLGGGGGGKPNMAQAGGKDATKIDEAIQTAKEFLGA